MVSVAVAMIVACFLPTQAASEPEPLTPGGCTDEGKLNDGLCSRGRPVYLPDGEAIDYVQPTKSVSPEWPA